VIQPKTKFSEEKVYWPGRKQVFRFTQDGIYHHDLLASIRENYPEATPLLEPVMLGGRRLAASPPVKQIREHALANLACLPQDYLLLRAAGTYPVEKSATLEQLLEDLRTQHFGAAKSPLLVREK